MPVLITAQAHLTLKYKRLEKLNLPFSNGNAMI